MFKQKMLQLHEEYIRLLKSYIRINVELLVRKKMRLKKNNVYICRIREGARELLEDLEILSDEFQFNHAISK